MAGGHATVEEYHQLNKLGKQPGPPHHNKGDPSSEKDNLDQNLGPQMPLLMMQYLCVTEIQGFFMYCMEEGETLDTL